jgi:hypothetical protein
MGFLKSRSFMFGQIGFLGEPFPVIQDAYNKFIFLMTLCPALFYQVYRR